MAPAEKPWRLAKSLVVLRDQINHLYPHRSKDWDGSVGDLFHSQRASDHNPDPAGVVHAIDVTHDPANGCDGRALADALRASADKRIKYVIHHGRIFSSTISPWQWRPYAGPNPHDHHVHISVNDRNADDERRWEL